LIHPITKNKHLIFDKPNISVFMKQSVLLAFLFCLFTSLSAQKIERKFVQDSLDNYINDALKTWKIPGIAVAIVKDGKVIIAKGYGICDLEKKDAVDENTIFMIGSNTKAFTGTLMAMMAHEKKCAMNDKVVKWLPDFKMKDPWVNRQVNLTDILSHRMGMETFQGDFMYWDSDLKNKEVIQKFGQLTPLYDFRTKWGYTNAGFTIAAECMKSISGETWEANLQKRVLDPLQMKRTIPFSADLPKQSNIATPYTLSFDTIKKLPFPMIDNLAAAASMGSSVKDMSNWLICLLDSGKFNGKSVIPYAAIKTAQTPTSIIGNARPLFNESHFRLYGLGWDLQDYQGKEIVYHNGGVNGFVTSVTLLPSEKLGIVVLTNTDQNYFYETLRWEILDAYLGLPFRNYSSIYHGYYKRSLSKDISEYKALKDSVLKNVKQNLDLKKYTGRYNHPVYGFLNIVENSGQLKVTFEHHSQKTATLEYMSSTRFLCTYSDLTYGIKPWDFKIENNKVIALTLRVADFLEFTTYDFVKQ
jgi:CubicO group peptidase (beta-lactamase class C family)